MSDAPNAYYDESGIAVFRASAIGSCEAALVYSLRGQEPAAPPAEMMARFQDGHLHEPAMLDWLRAQGYTVKAAQETISVQVNDRIRIDGHIDGLAVSAKGESYLVECKTMSQAAYEKWQRGGFDEYPKYAQQITVYMTALDLPCLYLVKNKNSGEINMRLLTEPPVLIAKLRAKAIRVERAARSDKTPECPKTYDYPCPFYRFHEDSRTHIDPGMAVEDMLDPKFDDLCQRYERFKDMVKQYSDLADRARDEIIAQLGASNGGRSNRYDVTLSTVESRRLDTKKIKAAMDVTQFEVVNRYQKLTVKERDDIRPQDAD